jgi:hypothetical protein
MEAYEAPGSWREAIEEERMLVDADGFRYKYVPKDHILAEDPSRHHKRHGHHGRGQAETGAQTSGGGYIYMKKPAKNQSASKGNEGSGMKQTA